MSKLARSTSFSFTVNQPVLPSMARRTIPRKEDVIAFYRTHERVSWSLAEVLDLGWNDIQIDALTPTDIGIVETALLVESNNPDYVSGLLEYFRADTDVCDFLMMWGIEEWKHYYALYDYLTKVRVALAARQDAGDEEHADTHLLELKRSVEAALDEKISNVRATSETNWNTPTNYAPVQVVANTTLQEFITADFYRNHARHTREPVLAKIETLLAKDETRHEMFYEKRMKDCLAADPALMPLVIDALKEFAMPGAYLLDDYDERRVAIDQALFPTLAEKEGVLVRLLEKISRLVGRENVLRVFLEGSYLTGGSDDRTRKKRREIITRLFTRSLSA